MFLLHYSFPKKIRTHNMIFLSFHSQTLTLHFPFVTVLGDEWGLNCPASYKLFLLLESFRPLLSPLAVPSPSFLSQEGPLAEFTMTVFTEFPFPLQLHMYSAASPEANLILGAFSSLFL